MLMHRFIISLWLALIHLIAISRCLPNLVSVVTGQTKDFWLIPNRDDELPVFSPEPDLRRQSTNIANAHEVLRLTLQQYLDAKDSDLGVYLKSIRERPDPFQDEYGQVITSYKKVFLFISEQFDEFKTQNYAVNQYDKDKLHLCSVARYFSHQTSLKDRQTLMKRMSDALDYKCHPCTPYKQKQYGTLEDIGLQVPITDYPEGITPEDSIGLCNTTNQSSETDLTTKSPIITTEIPLTSRPSMGFYEGKNGTWNRDGDFAPFPSPSDLNDKKNETQKIMQAHEILRNALKSFLDFSDADLGTYLNRMIRHSGNYQDEYGQVIPSYKKVFRFIMEQYNETMANNYAIGQFDKDKLDFCSVARFLSHQPKVDNRKNLMKRIGDALGYRCHPCTPYKRKEHDVTIVPETDQINPEGVSPEESFILCDNRTVTTSTTPNTLSLTTSGKPNHQAFNYKPCKYSKGFVACELATFEEIHEVFRRTSINTLEKIELTILPSEDHIPEDLLSNKKVAHLVLVYSKELIDEIGHTKLKVNANAFRSTKNYTKTIDLTGFDSIELDLSFLLGFNQLKNLTFYFIQNVHHSLPTLPSDLPNLQLLDFQGCSGLRELTNFPNLTNGLTFFSLKAVSEILDDETLSKMLDWVLLSSSNTLEYLRIEESNSITQVPQHISSFKALKSLIFRYNNVSTIKTGVLNFTAPVTYLYLHANGIKFIEPGAFHGNFKNAEIKFDGNNLTRFEESVFRPLRDQVISGKGDINGEQNPIDCGDENICHLAWLITQNNIGAGFFSNIRFPWTCSNGTRYLHLQPAGLNHCPGSVPNDAV